MILRRSSWSLDSNEMGGSWPGFSSPILVVAGVVEEGEAEACNYW